MSKQPLAYHDEEFLDSTDARPIRLLAEYLEPARRFRQANIQDTVVFFGSARVHSREDAQRELQELQKKKGRKAAHYASLVRRSRKAVEWSRYYEEARELASRPGKRSPAAARDAPPGPDCVPVRGYETRGLAFRRDGP